MAMLLKNHFPVHKAIHIRHTAGLGPVEVEALLFHGAVFDLHLLGSGICGTGVSELFALKAEINKVKKGIL